MNSRRDRNRSLVRRASILLLVGDLMMVAAGVWAARRLAGGLSFTAERIFDAEPVRPAASSVGPTLLAEALDSADQSPADAVRAVRPDTPQTGPARNNLLIFVGFVGVLALLTASLGLPYSGGYLSDRYLPPELGLWGIGAALALAVVGIIAVLAAAVLPRPLAFALLSGVALGAAVPFLTAVAVRTAGAPVQLNPVVGLGLAGAVLISASGLLARARLVQDGPAGAEESVPVSVRRLNVIGAVLSLLVAASAAAAWRLPQLRYNGGADPKLADGYSISSPLSLPFVVAMIVPLVGGVLWLVPALAKAGRAVAVIGWVALVYAVAQSLYVLGAVVASAAVPNAGFAPPVWSAGAGLWCGVAGMGLGIATLAVGVAASRGAADEALSVPDDDSLARVAGFRNRGRRRPDRADRRRARPARLSDVSRFCGDLGGRIPGQFLGCAGPGRRHDRRGLGRWPGDHRLPGRRLSAGRRRDSGGPTGGSGSGQRSGRVREGGRALRGLRHFGGLRGRRAGVGLFQ